MTLKKSIYYYLLVGVVKIIFKTTFFTIIGNNY